MLLLFGCSTSSPNDPAGVGGLAVVGAAGQEPGGPGAPGVLPATATDGRVSGDESDVDCGGPDVRVARCASGQRCKTDADCESRGCSFDGTCAMAPSCTALFGGQTCGPNETMEKQSDCCDRAEVGGAVVDKYLVTAGRMRTFLKRVDGHVRDFAATLPKEEWNAAFNDALPNELDGQPGDAENANTQLGPFFGKRSCQAGSHTGHTFWTPPEHGDTSDLSRDVLDTKALNCVPWWLLAALCAFDGGHLVLEKELRTAYTNGQALSLMSFPWGSRGDYTTSGQNEFAIQAFGYATPDPPASARRDANGMLDVAFYIAPPGRRPAGYNKTGHADLVGNLLEWVGDSERQFVWKGSFERHAEEADKRTPLPNDPYLARNGLLPWRWTDVVRGASDPENVNGYYAIGGRCAY